MTRYPHPVKLVGTSDGRRKKIDTRWAEKIRARCAMRCDCTKETKRKKCFNDTAIVNGANEKKAATYKLQIASKEYHKKGRIELQENVNWNKPSNKKSCYCCSRIRSLIPIQWRTSVRFFSLLGQALSLSLSLNSVCVGRKSSLWIAIR